ncbi:hypothetical protein JL722_12426 [Aureococcus anophagefferens]|nr:hypothetical protein JL722_12426 [Aureococcus anophagefferens]
MPLRVGPNVTAERTSQAMTANKALCNTIMIEPGWRFDDCAKTVLDAVVARPAHSSMWTSYTWLLLVRDPLERPGESYYILTELVGVRTVDRKHNARPKGGPLSVAPVRGEWAYAKARGYDLSLEDRRLLRLASVCDLHVVDKANRMITELAAAYGYQPPRVNHA